MKKTINIRSNKNILPTVNATESKDFIKRFNKNIISPEMLETCREAARLFHSK